MNRWKKSKPKNVRGASEQLQRGLRRGRPSKAEQRRILAEQGPKIIAEEFRRQPLRGPVDPQFEPYFNQVLRGNAQAIAQYCDTNAGQVDLSSSFYELLGRLVTIRFYRAADIILSDIERRGAIGFPTDREAYVYWYKFLLPLAERAKEWVRSEVANDLTPWKRDRAWLKYANEISRPDPPGLCDLERHRIITYSQSEPLYMGDYIRLGIVPRELFILVAENKGGVTRPSHAVRKYLQDVRGLSYSKPSRKACARK